MSTTDNTTPAGMPIVAYEFVNDATLHKIVHYSHAQLFTPEKGYKPEPLVKLSDALAALSACQVDAERYRWLRDHSQDYDEGLTPFCAIPREDTWGKHYNAQLSGEELDTEIDAAITAKGQAS